MAQQFIEQLVGQFSYKTFKNAQFPFIPGSSFAL